MRQQISSVRERGHLVTAGLTVRDTRAVTVPVRDAAGNAIAALTVIGTSARLSDGRIGRVIDTLHEGSLQASQAIWRNGALPAGMAPDRPI